jgi:hypothetical protein
MTSLSTVIPAKAGIQLLPCFRRRKGSGIPAFAEMTKEGRHD